MTGFRFRSRSVLAGGLLAALAGCATVPAPPPEASALPIEDVPDLALPQGPATLQVRGTPRQGALLRGLVPVGTLGLTLDGVPVAVDAEGNFIIGLDRDAPATMTLEATGRDGRKQRRVLTIARGDWKIQNVNASITGSATSEEFQQRRAGELARIVAARGDPQLSNGWRQTFIWPVKARISGVFGSQRIYRGTPGSYHSGLDLAGGQGTVYVAPADGVVVLASEDPFTLEGKLLIIDHGMGINSAFLHSDRLLVKEGDVVRQGQPLGEIGATGRVTGPHLHWSMKWNDARIDPLPLVQGQAAR
ncbi:murein DD-endopeptidase MepM/ murein hydrolase activator NlpD [Sphingobium sp. B7D2B]|uniref:M23 family metallopeptidase n=1 Tax=Sphingobium sp. B7D2B TaxID=2940583 RepID=UPI0022257A0E|nr:M23 family metallopeptidase [Sphingobium sp. B7D2B]MCW2365252.1 murein DD-endopeptidase MepM/ murein hydrolase activator NlpD [Sphingobium sp. B7D2B]